MAAREKITPTINERVAMVLTIDGGVRSSWGVVPALICVPRNSKLIRTQSPEALRQYLPE